MVKRAGEPKDGMRSGEDARGIIAELNEHLRELLDLLSRLADACPCLLSDGQPPDSPAVEKAFIARRLGRTRAGLDSYIQKYRQRFTEDPPWVIRKPGLPWLPDVEAFEAWRRTSEGEKAIPKRRRTANAKKEG